MRRQTFKTKLGEGAVRYRTVVEDDDSIQDSEDAKVRARQFLASMLTDHPDLLRCGLNEFQKLRMVHDGTRWVIETEAEVQEAAG